MSNQRLAELFEQIADLLELTGEQPFRVNSYRKVARALEGLEQPAAKLTAKELEKAPGIGKSSAAKVLEAVTAGRIALLDTLKETVPPGLPALLRIPGLGPKRVRSVWQSLGVVDVASLKARLDDGSLEGLAGFGAKSAEKLRAGLALAEVAEQRLPLGVAWPFAEHLVAQLQDLPGVTRITPAGSLRRRRDTVGDIDLLAQAEDSAAIIQAFVGLPEVETVLAQGDTKASCRMDADGASVQVDLRVLPAASYGAALQYFTGSQDHNVALRERVAKRGWKLNEYGLFDAAGKQLAGETEEGVYAAMGLSCPPPELRENRGELDWAQAPALLDARKICGDLHLHTDWSDGRDTLEEMAQAALALGYRYLCVTDHSVSSRIANGLDAARLAKQVERVRQLDASKPGLRVLVGSEVDIKADGTLDYPDELLAQLDWVVASVHAGLDGERAKVTARVVKAIQSPYVCAIGHPTGRLINARPPMDLDLPEVFKAAAAHGTLLEINSSWQRMDLSDANVRAAKSAGCRFTVNTDAHSVPGLGAMRYGVAIARRAGLGPEDVINTLDAESLLSWVKAKRAGSREPRP